MSPITIDTLCDCGTLDEAYHLPDCQRSAHRGKLAGVWPGNYYEGCDCEECRTACKNPKCHEEKEALLAQARQVTGAHGERMVRHDLMKLDLILRLKQRLHNRLPILAREAVEEVEAEVRTVFKEWPAQ